MKCHYHFNNTNKQQNQQDLLVDFVIKNLEK